MLFPPRLFTRPNLRNEVGSLSSVGDVNEVEVSPRFVGHCHDLHPQFLLVVPVLEALIHHPNCQRLKLSEIQIVNETY